MLQLIENSSQAVDAGQAFEAQRIAVELRKLFHDTKQSTSLLTHLDAWKVQLLTSPTLPAGLTDGMTRSWPNLIQCRIQGQETHFIMCGDAHQYVLVDAKTWWDEEVWFVPSEAEGITRRQIVRAAANQDGGAHIDAEIDQVYRAVRLAGGLHVHRHDKGTTILFPLNDPELADEECQPDSDMITACLRQMAYEVLRSEDLREL